MNEIKLNTIIFPIWFAVFFPPYVFFILVGNLLIDWSVIYFTLKCKQEKIQPILMKYLVLKSWMLGFLATIIGAISLFFLNEWLDLEDYQIWDSPFTVFVYAFVVLVVGLLIYYFNFNLCFQFGLKKTSCIAVGVSMGIVTAPWLLLVPITWFF